jgi:hypothetical protein
MVLRHPNGIYRHSDWWQGAQKGRKVFAISPWLYNGKARFLCSQVSPLMFECPIERPMNDSSNEVIENDAQFLNGYKIIELIQCDLEFEFPVGTQERGFAVLKFYE